MAWGVPGRPIRLAWRVVANNRADDNRDMRDRDGKNHVLEPSFGPLAPASTAGGAWWRRGPQSRGWLVWVGMLLPLLALAGASFLAIRLRAEGRETRRTEEHLSRVIVEGARVNGLEWEIAWQLVAEGAASGETLSAIADARGTMRESVGELLQGDPEDGDVQALATLYATFDEALQDELNLALSGQAIAARDVDDARVDPAFDLLIDQVGGVRDKHRVYSTAVDTRAFRANLGVLVAMVGAAVVLVFVVGRLRHRVAADRLEREAEERILEDPGPHLDALPRSVGRPRLSPRDE